MPKILLLSFVGVGTVYLLFSNGNEAEVVAKEDTSASEVETIPEEELSSSGTGTLESLMARGANLECNITYTPEGGAEDISGTYFTSQGKVRGDFIVASNNTDIVSSIIMRDEKLYSWSEIDGEKYGMLIDLKAMEAQKLNGEVPDTKEPVPLDSPVKYECKAWTSLDGSIFEPPTDIVFRDFSNIMDAGMEFGNIYEESGSAEDQCALCARVPAGEGRDSCNVAFSCQ